MRRVLVNPLGLSFESRSPPLGALSEDHGNRVPSSTVFGEAHYSRVFSRFSHRADLQSLRCCSVLMRTRFLGELVDGRPKSHAHE